MAGDWIKFEKATPDKPEVMRVARALGADRDLVVGKLLRLWAWIDANSDDGVVDGVVGADVDALVALDGFCRALADVGWLIVDESSERIEIPNFERHNGATAKKRAEKTRRQGTWRKRSQSVDAPVDQTVDEHAPTTAPTREEKRREEKIKDKTPLNPPPPQDVDLLGQPNGQHKKSATVCSDEQAAKIYNAYPRKVGREVAIRRIKSAARKLKGEGYGDPAGFLLERTKTFAASPAGQRPPPDGEDYRAHPSTWFNQGRYFDDEQEWQKPNGVKQSETGLRGGIRAEPGKYDELERDD